jgi:hypothetical protein
MGTKMNENTGANDMSAKYITITLGDIAREVEDMDSGSPLEPGDHDVIVEWSGSRYEIVDGFHRVAGYVASGADMDDEIVVILCDDGDLIGRAAEPGGDQQEALDEIIEMAEDAE